MQAMQIDEALEHADEWIKGVTMYEGAQGWRVACATLASEVRRLRYVLSEAERVLRIAASYDPEEWPTAGLKIHCKDAKLWADNARDALGPNVELSGLRGCLRSSA